MLMAYGRVPVRFRPMLGGLELRVRFHTPLTIVPGQFEHSMIQGMKSGQRYELELVSHRPELALETSDRRCIELGAPVEGRRAVVGEVLSGEFRMDALREHPSFLQIRFRGPAPQEIRIGRI